MICTNNVSIDQAIAQYQRDKSFIEKCRIRNNFYEANIRMLLFILVSDFKQQLLNRLSPDDEEHVLERLDELYQTNADLKSS